MGDKIMFIYKHADNDLGYVKEIVEEEGFKGRDGWHLNQTEAINDAACGATKADKKTTTPEKVEEKPKKARWFGKG